MGRKEVNIIKKEKETAIARHSASKYGVIFGHADHLTYEACFAGMVSKIKEVPVGTSMQYLLRFETSWGIFKYDLLFKELNKMFGTYFKILRFFSGTKNVRIINIEEVGEFPDKRLRHMAYMILVVLLRTIDAEFIVPRWKPDFDTNDKIYPLKKWNDVLFHYHRFGIAGHGVNDDIAELQRSGSKKLYKQSVTNYFKIIEIAFGGNFDFTKKGVKSRLKNGYSITTGYHRNFAQTPSFRLIEKIVKDLS